MPKYLFTPYFHDGSQALSVIIEAESQEAVMDVLDKYYAERDFESVFGLIDLLHMDKVEEIALDELTDRLDGDWPPLFMANNSLEQRHEEAAIREAINQVGVPNKKLMN